MSYAVIIKHLPGKHDQKTHGVRKSANTTMPIPAIQSVALRPISANPINPKGGTSDQQKLVNDTIARIPKSLLKNAGIAGITIEDSDIAYFRTMKTLGYFHPLNKTINLAGRNPNLAGTTAHELGHAIFMKNRKTVAELNDNYAKLKSTNGKFVTDYAKSHQLEYQAEVFKFYVTKPEVLKTVDKTAYDIMERLWKSAGN